MNINEVISMSRDVKYNIDVNKHNIECNSNDNRVKENRE